VRSASNWSFSKALRGIADAIRNREARLKALWSGRLAYQMTMLPEFDQMFRVVLRTLRQAERRQRDDSTVLVPGARRDWPPRIRMRGKQNQHVGRLENLDSKSDSIIT
jgi:hypothetical protein